MSARPDLAEQLRPFVAAAFPQAEVLDAVQLPRGARPLAGLGRPLLIAVTRWPVVPPSGIVLAGDPEAVAAILGAELPARPEPSPEAGHGRRASDRAEEAEAAADDAPPPDPAPEPAADDEESPPPARRWTDRAALAITPAADAAAVRCITALAGLVGLPVETAETQAMHAERDAEADAAIGVVPDAFSFELQLGEHRARVIVVTGVLIGARLAADATAAGSASGPAAAPAEGAPDAPAPAADRHPALGAIPLAVQARVGRAALPLRTVMALQPGALLELDAASSAEVELVTGGVTLATGSLQLDDDGLLEFEVSA